MERLYDKVKKNFDDTLQKNKKFEKLLRQKTITNATKDRLVELLLNRIVISKVNDDKDNIELKIFFNFSPQYAKNEMGDNIVPSVDGLKCFLRKDYEFKRGYDKTGTKRYSVKYKVNCYI